MSMSWTDKYKIETLERKVSSLEFEISRLHDQLREKDRHIERLREAKNVMEQALITAEQTLRDAGVEL